MSLGGAPSPTPTLDNTLLLSGQCLIVESLVATHTPAMSGVSTYMVNTVIIVNTTLHTLTILSTGELSLQTRECLSDCLRSVKKMLASLPLDTT